MEYHKLKQIFFSIYENDMNMETLIQLLKNANVSQSQTTMLLCKELNIPFFESDSLVLNSKAWSDIKEINIKGRNDLIKGIEDLE